MAELLSTINVRHIPAIVTRVYLDGVPSAELFVRGPKGAIRYDLHVPGEIAGRFEAVAPEDRFIEPEANDIAIRSATVGSPAVVVIWTGPTRPAALSDGPRVYVTGEVYQVGTCNDPNGGTP